MLRHYPKIEYHGPATKHDMPCAIHFKEPAILNTSRGVFNPSWKAQKQGWHLVYANTKFKKWVIKKLFKGNNYD